MKLKSLAGATSALLFLMPLASAQPRSFKQQMQLVTESRQGADLLALQKTGEELLLPGTPYTLAERRKLMVEVCSALASTDFGDLNGRPYAEKLALRAMEADPQMDYWTKVKLVWSFDGVPREKLRLSEWQQLREKKALAIATEWTQLANDLRGFDPEKRDFVYQVPLPPGVGIPQGGAPEAIQDPILRAEYSHKVADNCRKSELYHQKFHKAQALEELLMVSEPLLISLYSTAPSDEKNLRTLLTSVDDTDKTKQRILAAVERTAQELAQVK